MDIKALDLTDLSVAEQLWALQHAAYRLEADLIGVAGLPPLTETVQSLQEYSGTFYGCISHDGELAGALSIKAEKSGEWVISRVMVHPEYVRRGIATRLLQHIQALAPRGTKLAVTAEIRNTPALRLYEQCGFIRSGISQPVPYLTMIRLEKQA